MASNSLIKPGGEVHPDEIRMAVAHGIEGLKRAKAPDEYGQEFDDWLDFFEMTYNDLYASSSINAGFPSENSELSDYKDDEEYQEQGENLKKIAEIAEEVKETEPENRVQLEDKIDRGIVLAEKFYEAWAVE